jgi:hypothetical protein
MADVAKEADAQPSALLSLPHAVLQIVFAQLPVDLRASCSCVCRGWRDAVAERSLWTRLDVSRTRGITIFVTDAFLRGAAARAGGALQSVDVSECHVVSHEALLAVATAHAATLHELRCCNSAFCFLVLPVRTLQHAEALLHAAPALHVLDADLDCVSVADARRALHAESLLAPLRLHSLHVHTTGAAEADILALAADVGAHA